MPAPPQVLCGVVVSAGRMMKAVKVRTVKQVYDSFLQKVIPFSISLRSSLFLVFQLLTFNNSTTPPTNPTWFPIQTHLSVPATSSVLPPDRPQANIYAML